MLTAVIILVLLILIFAGLYASYYKTFYSPHRDASETESPEMLKGHPYGEETRSHTARLYELPCEYLHARSFDGLRLSARYYQGDPEKPLCICFHGYRGSAVRDFSGTGLYLIDEGYNVILVDERAHWRSQGHTITYGINERCDVLTWIEVANRRFGAEKPIFLFGISMGGGTVLMASGQELPENVKGIVADCPFNSPKDIIRHVCRKINLNPTLAWIPVWLSSHIYGHFNINATTAADEVKKTKKPIMIVHGEGDDFVPPYMSRQVYDANPDMIEIHTFPDAGHGMSYYYDPERFQGLISRFIEKHQ